ncbi:MAG: PD40 domain-containing protein [Thermoleophilaceae bacterium]|nr:PD40 domain-containing protein [Thermoleophilaceae bacterium]
MDDNWLVRGTAGAVTASLLLGGLVLAPGALGAFPGTNGRIAFQTTNGLGTMNASGGDRLPLVSGTGVFATPTWSPDGRRVAFASNRDTATFEIYVTGAQGGAVTRLTTNSVQDGNPTWSPDGRRIAFESERADGRPQIWVMDADGGGPVRVTTSVAEDRAPAWSPDGTRIAFARGPDGNADIWSVPASGGVGTPLTIDPADETNPDWAPTGNRIAFQRGGTIAVMAANGTGQAPLPLPGGGARPAWAPDGSRILFDLAAQIYVANANGTGTVQLTSAGSSSLIAQAPTWQPVPRVSGPGVVDRDGDGVPASSDCNDGDPGIRPGAEDKPGDRIDQDCSGRDARWPLLKRKVGAALSTSRTGGYTLVASLVVKPVRKGDVLRLTCRGRGCRRRAVTVRVKKSRSSLSLLRYVRGARLRKKAIVQLRVTRRGALGRVTTWKIRAPKRPLVSRACLVPGKKKPSRC